MELSDYRQQIDGIDSQLLALFYQRMEVAAQIAGYKKAHNLPALDAGRERAKLQQIADAAPEDLREYTVSLYSLIFELSRSCQNRLLGVTNPLTAEIEQAIARTPQLFPEHPAVACQGVEGAYSQLACDRLFTMPNVFYCATFEAVFAAIEKGLCRYGVIPLENSTAGSVNAVYDLMMQHNFRIVRSVRLKIDHCLLAKPGTKLSDIKEIYSHEQAISQCGRFLRQAAVHEQNVRRDRAALTQPQGAAQEIFQLRCVLARLHDERDARVPAGAHRREQRAAEHPQQPGKAQDQQDA